MINKSFSDLLSGLRNEAQLTNLELAELADVPKSLIGGLQSGKRRIGEYQANKIGVALGLTGEELQDFIFRAINNCTEKVLVESKDYPAELLNLLAIQLRQAGILPNQVQGCVIGNTKTNVGVLLNDGRTAKLETTLAIA